MGTLSSEKKSVRVRHLNVVKKQVGFAQQLDARLRRVRLVAHHKHLWANIRNATKKTGACETKLGKNVKSRCKQDLGKQMAR